LLNLKAAVKAAKLQTHEELDFSDLFLLTIRALREQRAENRFGRESNLYRETVI
jgi:hypothetical protein